MMGFIEVYSDYLGNVGSWESYVQIVDPETTKVSQLLAKSAQYFENKMPYGPWKKVFPDNYAPPALMAYYFQEIAEMRSGGYNLPNFDDIRRDVGFKNIIRLPLPGETENPERKAILTELYQSFGVPARAEHLLEKQRKARLVLVLLHEIIGHGSGTYDTTLYGPKEDPISALAVAGGSALEEQRADLAALVFAADPKLVEVGLYPSLEEAIVVRNAMYDLYLIDFLRVIARDHSLAEAHMRGHWLLIKQLMDQGAVAWVDPVNPTGMPIPSNQVLAVKDYEGFWKVCNQLLSDLQSIKANRQTEKLEALFRVQAPLSEIDADWAQAIIQRGENLKVNSESFEQSWVIDAQLGFLTVSDTSLEGIARSWTKLGYDRQANGSSSCMPGSLCFN